jgi:3-hydroxymyristoyl/3-hydroxydecanoyl-(acyl carrier protein) dehydratase
VTSTPLALPDPHPATEGHFPGAPVLPAVVLLDEALCAIEADGAQGPWRITTVKFLHPVLPGEALRLEHERLGSGGIRFRISSAAGAVATGQLARV